MHILLAGVAPLGGESVLDFAGGGQWELGKEQQILDLDRSLPPPGETELWEEEDYAEWYKACCPRMPGAWCTCIPMPRCPVALAQENTPQLNQVC